MIFLIFRKVFWFVDKLSVFLVCRLMIIVEEIEVVCWFLMINVFEGILLKIGINLCWYLLLVINYVVWYLLFCLVLVCVFMFRWIGFNVVYC